MEDIKKKKKTVMDWPGNMIKLVHKNFLQLLTSGLKYYGTDT